MKDKWLRKAISQNLTVCGQETKVNCEIPFCHQTLCRAKIFLTSAVIQMTHKHKIFPFSSSRIKNISSDIPSTSSNRSVNGNIWETTLPDIMKEENDTLSYTIYIEFYLPPYHFPTTESIHPAKEKYTQIPSLFIMILWLYLNNNIDFFFSLSSFHLHFSFLIFFFFINFIFFFSFGEHHHEAHKFSCKWMKAAAAAKEKKNKFSAFFLVSSLKLCIRIIDIYVEHKYGTCCWCHIFMCTWRWAKNSPHPIKRVNCGRPILTYR